MAYIEFELLLQITKKLKTFAYFRCLEKGREKKEHKF